MTCEDDYHGGLATPPVKPPEAPCIPPEKPKPAEPEPPPSHNPDESIGGN